MLTKVSAEQRGSLSRQDFLGGGGGGMLFGKKDLSRALEDEKVGWEDEHSKQIKQH